MKCESCGLCQTIKYNNSVYEIRCVERGDFNLHSDHEDAFEWEDYAEREYTEPPKENIIITLKCGRDFFIRDEDITCNDDMQRRMGASEEWVEFDGILFRTSEIAAVSFVG